MTATPADINRLDIDLRPVAEPVMKRTFIKDETVWAWFVKDAFSNEFFTWAGEYEDEADGPDRRLARFIDRADAVSFILATPNLQLWNGEIR